MFFSEVFDIITDPAYRGWEWLGRYGDRVSRSRSANERDVCLVRDKVNKGVTTTEQIGTVSGIGG